MNAFDLDAAATRLEAYLLSLRNTAVDPDEPLVLDVFDLVDDAMRNDNVAHKTPCVGLIHDDESLKINELIGGGFEQEGTSTWVFVLMCASPVRGQGMRGPRGAMTISGQLMDALNNFHIDGDEGACPMSVIRRKRFAPPEESVKAICGYSIIATHPVVN